MRNEKMMNWKIKNKMMKKWKNEKNEKKSIKNEYKSITITDMKTILR